MYYKKDWEKAKERLLAFWQGEIVDRCCIGILAPRKNSKAERFPHLTNGPWLGGLEKFSDNDIDEIKQWWLDPEQNYKRATHWFENTYFGGEAAPAAYVNWGASAGCAFFGCSPVFGKASVWYKKVIENWDEWEWQFNEEINLYWKQIFNITEYLKDKCDKRYFIGVPEIGNSADNLSLMRGMDDLALDLILNKDEVKAAVDIMSDNKRKITVYSLI